MDFVRVGLVVLYAACRLDVDPRIGSEARVRICLGGLEMEMVMLEVATMAVMMMLLGADKLSFGEFLYLLLWMGRKVDNWGFRGWRDVEFWWNEAISEIADWRGTE